MKHGSSCSKGKAGGMNQGSQARWRLDWDGRFHRATKLKNIKGLFCNGSLGHSGEIVSGSKWLFGRFQSHSACPVLWAKRSLIGQQGEGGMRGY